MEVSRTFNVAVEGNIGCGKSTFLNYFKGLSPKIQISLEPIVLWNDVKGFKLFEVFYGDPNRWSTPFESQVMATFFERQAEKQTAPVRLLERSVHTCRYCFIEAMNRNRQLSDEDLEVFDKFYDWGMSFPTSKLDLIVYLRCSPEICAERIRKRDRRGESAISMASFTSDYLNQLHDLHEDWLLGTKRDCVGAPVMVFDCDEPLEVLTDVYFQRRDQVLCGVPV
ncbi:Deoxynucleoside kinase [Echinococcus granulosus]|uniref:Deoxynucleoside kinase n=1 Tax=Echinococcus granulosus TaxID=6210 RepID=W6U052_ECHGR|nr:Deoxynucleoside kinase [Echinococcus granulosus]EUB54403.1 Deoxynucleoside kinase [Echinococcus granulosus]